ncbi:hypothetical protein [Lacrimispora amygdalina]|uniref:hypothetical protein n=1 Tax=Lacrimispora amygdalina TaxID=253257 RepID=UPI000BE2C152|nr:hypothetical protein [Lacrimispora amygdalina]
MTANERNDFLYGLVQNYVIEKQNNVVYNRDNAESYSYTKGRLNGALTALELDMVETPLYVIIETRQRKELLRYQIS